MTAPSGKRFYSILDTSFIGVLPQSGQHLVVAGMAQRAGGHAVFYTMEDHYTLGSHEVILAKLAENPGIDGLIFFRIDQFFHGSRPRLDVLRRILAQGFEVHFARERLSLRSPADLDRAFAAIHLSRHLHERDARHDYFRPLLDARKT